MPTRTSKRIAIFSLDLLVRALLLLATTCIFSLPCSAQSSGLDTSAPWPKPGQNSANTSIATGYGAMGAKRWVFGAPDEGQFDPIIGSDGTVYFSNNQECFYAVSGATGALKWKVTSNLVSGGAALGANGLIYLMGQGILTALDSATGTQKWVTHLLESSGYSPGIGSDGTVYVPAGLYMYALDGDTGAIKWYVRPGGHVNSPAIGPDGTLYITSDSQGIYAMNPADGSIKWTYNGSNHFWAPATLAADGTLYVGTQEDSLLALDSSTGALEWTYPLAGQVLSCPAIGADGTVFVAGGALYAFDPTTHMPKWTDQGLAQDFASWPVVAGDGTVYIESQTLFFAIDPQTGAKKWILKVYMPGTTAPAIGADGTVYECGNGGLIAISSVEISRFYTASSSIVGGSPTTGIVQLNSGAIQGKQVATLSSSSPLVTVPSSLNFALGQTGLSFPIHSSTVTTQATVTLTATFNSFAVQTTLTVNPYPLAKFYVASNSFFGGGKTTAVVQLTGDGGPGGDPVSLWSSSPDVSVPASVSVPDGSIGTSFQVPSVPVSAQESVTLTANIGTSSMQTTITLNPYPLSAIVVPLGGYYGGTSIQIEFELSGPAGAAGNLVDVTSTDPSAPMPPTVTVPAGSSHVFYIVQTQPVSSTHFANFSAEFGGVTQQNALYLFANQLTAISASPSTVLGGKATTGTVSLGGPAGSGGNVVTLHYGSGLSMPSSVTVPAGQSQVSFPIETSPVSQSAACSFSASFEFNIVSGSVTLTPASLSNFYVSPSALRSC